MIGRDGRPLEGPTGQDLSFEKFAINIGPGQTWDVLFKWYDAENYDPVTNPVPVTVPSLANQEIGIFYSGSPYLGHDGGPAARDPDAEPVRRVLHHLAQPRPVPDHLVGREHDRSDHVHADRPARAQRLRMTREVGSTMTPRTSMHKAALSLLASGALALMTVLLGPIDQAAAATVTIDLYAVTGSTTLPAGGQNVTVWGYNDSAAAVNRPGGPTLVVTEGDTVELTLHNQLTEPTALLFQGQAMVPDTTGAAPAGTKAVHLHGEPTRHLPVRGGAAAQRPAPGGDGPVRRPDRAARRSRGRPMTIRPPPSTTRRCWSSARSTRRSTTPPPRRPSTCASTRRATS